MSRARAFAKLNLALVVGPIRADGKHEVATVLQTIDLCDDIELTLADELTIVGFSEDTLVRDALERLAAGAGLAPKWRVLIEKRIPVAAGLGGGSSDAATAVELANTSLPTPLSEAELHALAAAVGADVPFFLRKGPQLGTGDGSDLAALDLPTGYVVLLVLPEGATKESTAAVYRRFDEHDGAVGFEERRSQLLDALERVDRPTDLGTLPGNDLASSPIAQHLVELGAFRADVTGAGPTVYGLFDQVQVAESAAASLPVGGRTWLVRPVPQRCSPTAMAR